MKNTFMSVEMAMNCGVYDSLMRSELIKPRKDICDRFYLKPIAIIIPL